MRVAAVQHTITWEDPDATFAGVSPLIADAARSGAELICVAEMFSTGFSMAPERVAEPVDGPSVSFLVDQAAAHDTILVGSAPTKDPGFERPVNQLVVCNADGVIGRYNKIHPFSFAGEDKHYAAGSDYLTLDLHGVRTTFFVCYDLRFADEFWNTAAQTDLYVVVANWPRVRRTHWSTLLRARAIENQAYVLATNRVGAENRTLEDSGLDHSGDSTLIDPFGEVLLHAAEIETTLVGEVSSSYVAEVRARLPFAADRR